MKTTLPMLTTDTNRPPADSEESGGRATGAVVLAAIGLLAIFLVLAASSDGTERSESAQTFDSLADFSGVGPSRMVLEHLRLRDTVYTTDSIYLELNLTRQQVTVHCRDGRAESFPVSSGNPAIREGMATPSGLFTVQNMTPMAISRQFNDAKLHHWIGIQGGVGFHGLDGTGYYGYLGVRPSSHGCVRMSREDARQLFRLVHPGALILVHAGEPARVVAFCRPADTINATLIDSASVFDRNLGVGRLRGLMRGKAWIDPQPRIVHLARQRLRWGMEVGKAERIPRQSLPEPYPSIDGMFLVPVAEADLAGRAGADRMRAAASREARRLLQHQQAEWSHETQKEPEYGE